MRDDSTTRVLVPAKGPSVCGKMSGSTSFGPRNSPGGALLYSGVRVEIGKGVGIMILTFLGKQAKIK